VKTTTRPAPRWDPKTIFAVHADHADGLSPSEIATKRDLPLLTVQAFLRPSEQTCRLASPYRFRRGRLPDNAAIQAYWLGYIAATGRVCGQQAFTTLVLSIHRDDERHVETLAADLVVGHARVEFVDSSLDGRQAYIRDRALGEVLTQWGLAATREALDVPLEYLPPAVLPDFARGYLEGSRLERPFGGRASGPRRAPVRLALAGPTALIRALAAGLQAACGVRAAAVTPSRESDMARAVFSRADSAKVMARLYHRPVRSSPRAAPLAARFAEA
jgi:hypothetical protein